MSLVTIQWVHDVVKHLMLQISFEGDNLVFQKCREDDIMIKAWRNGNNNSACCIVLLQIEAAKGSSGSRSHFLCNPGKTLLREQVVS